VHSRRRGNHGYQGRKYPQDAAIQARKLLQGVNAKILGVVLNGITEADLKYGSYSYYYSNYYGDGYDNNKGKRKGKQRITYNNSFRVVLTLFSILLASAFIRPVLSDYYSKGVFELDKEKLLRASESQ